MAKITASQQRLKHIETSTFNSGKALNATFSTTQNLATLRVAVQCFRTSMQAMRDQARYNTGSKSRKP